MSGISRRALFGLSVGAAAAAVVKPAVADPVIVGMDFGKRPAIMIRDGYVIDLREIEVDIDFTKPAMVVSRSRKWIRENPDKVAEYQRRGIVLK